jgi:hypothetical protein
MVEGGEGRRREGDELADTTLLVLISARKKEIHIADQPFWRVMFSGYYFFGVFREGQTSDKCEFVMVVSPALLHGIFFF